MVSTCPDTIGSGSSHDPSATAMTMTPITRRTTSTGNATSGPKEHLRASRQQDPLAWYRTQHIRVALAASVLVILTTSIYISVNTQPLYGRPLFLSLAVFVVVAMISAWLYSWRRLPAILHGDQPLYILYIWSITDISAIAVAVALSGGAHSEVYLAYFVLLLFLAGSAYPLASRIALSILAVVSYIAALGVTGWHISASRLTERVGILITAATAAVLLSDAIVKEFQMHKADLVSRASAERSHYIRFRSMLQGAPEAILTIDSSGTINGLNTKAEELFGYGESQLTGRDISMLLPNLKEYIGWDTYVEHPIQRTITGGNSLTGKQVGRDGQVITLEATIGPISELEPGTITHAGISSDSTTGDSTGPQAFILVLRDVTRQRELEDKLAHDAYYDPLTELPNRNFLTRYLAGLVEGMPDSSHAVCTASVATMGKLPTPPAGTRFDETPPAGAGGVTDLVLTVDDAGFASASAVSRTTPASNPSAHLPMSSRAILYLDIDGFKKVNDTKGHDIGDKILHSVAERLKSNIRRGDIMSRYDSDEFVILAHDIHDEKSAVAYANHILRSFDNPFTHDNIDILLNAHIGFTIMNPDDRNEDPIGKAAMAMDKAKKRNNGRAVAFTAELASRINDRIAIEYDLHNALQEQQFFLAYQPIVSLSTRKVAGFEALVRWNHPKRGIVPPLSFIPVAEDAGYIADIGRWVLEESCLQLATLHGANTEASNLSMSVNVSSRQLDSDAIISDIANTLEVSGLRPDRLVLEITESCLIDELKQAVRRLEIIKSLGVRISLDDFGTGYSSLTWLSRLPIDVVKIDKSFIDRLGSQDDVIISAILSVASTFDLQVVAEGIEKEEQSRLLTALGCQLAQGYLFAKPLPMIEAATLAIGTP